jgi:hypothetical protein
LGTVIIRSDEVGDPKKMPLFQTFSMAGDPYEFVCVPKISQISSNTGSVEGQIIVIKGSGFSNNPLEVSVKADELNCKVLTSSNNQIVCEVEKDTRVSRPTFNKGQTGLIREFFELKTYMYAESLKINLQNNPVGSASRLKLTSRDLIFELGTNPRYFYYK